MNEALRLCFAGLLGLAGGLAVGSGFVAFITVLDLIPRLAQIVGKQRTSLFEGAVTAGAILFTTVDFFAFRATLPSIFMAGIGLLCGMFVGMLAAALTEVLNVLPILAKRLRLDRFIVWLLMAMVFGKMAGSLFHWIWFVRLE